MRLLGARAPAAWSRARRSRVSKVTGTATYNTAGQGGLLPSPAGSPLREEDEAEAAGHLPVAGPGRPQHGVGAPWASVQPDHDQVVAAPAQRRHERSRRPVLREHPAPERADEVDPVAQARAEGWIHRRQPVPGPEPGQADAVVVGVVDEGQRRLDAGVAMVDEPPLGAV